MGAYQGEDAPQDLGGEASKKMGRVRRSHGAELGDLEVSVEKRIRAGGPMAGPARSRSGAGAGAEAEAEARKTAAPAGVLLVLLPEELLHGGLILGFVGREQVINGFGWRKEKE